jgi:hypothetical protein
LTTAPLTKGFCHRRRPGILAGDDVSDFELNFERAAGEFAKWRAVPEKERSPAPAWWWQPAFELLELHEVMQPQWCQRLEIPLQSTYADGAAVLLATLADQTSLPWPDEFPRKIKRDDEKEQLQAPLSI